MLWSRAKPSPYPSTQESSQELERWLFKLLTNGLAQLLRLNKTHHLPYSKVK
jgi:hypothetical protein